MSEPSIVGTWETSKGSRQQPLRGVNAIASFSETGFATISIYDPTQPSAEFTGKYELDERGLRIDVPGLRGKTWPITLQPNRLVMASPQGTIIFQR